MRQIRILNLIGALGMVCHAAPNNDSSVPSTSESELSCLEQRALEKKNKELALAACQALFGDNDADAVDKYYHKDIINHNPWIADGSEAFKQFIKEVWSKGREKTRVDVHRISAEGNLVWYQGRTKEMEGPDNDFIDIVRIENGKIVEFWDVVQPVPDLSNSKNPHAHSS